MVLVVNELRDEPHNEFLRLFASKQKVRKHTMEEVLDQPLSNWSEELWSVVFGLQQFYQLEEESMKRELTVDDVMEMGNNIRKRVIASASPEDRLAGLAPEERLAGLAPEELASMMEQIEALLSKNPLKKTRHRRKS